MREARTPPRADSLPKALPADYGLDATKTHTSRELEALIKRVIKTKNVDLKAFFDALTPNETAFIAGLPEFDVLMLSMAVRASDGTERLTRGQWKALEYLEKRVKAGKAKRTSDESTDDDGPLTVEPTSQPQAVGAPE